MSGAAAEPSERRRQVAVIGAGGCGQDSEAARLAEEVGRGLAEAGAALVWAVSAG